jgi:hypothetical protein
MFALFAMLILAHGPLNWSFPFWLWMLAIFFGLYSVFGEHKCACKEK